MRCNCWPRIDWTRQFFVPPYWLLIRKYPKLKRKTKHKTTSSGSNRMKAKAKANIKSKETETKWERGRSSEKWNKYWPKAIDIFLVSCCDSSHLEKTGSVVSHTETQKLNWKFWCVFSCAITIHTVLTVQRRSASERRKIVSKSEKWKTKFAHLTVVSAIVFIDLTWLSWLHHHICVPAPSRHCTFAINCHSISNDSEIYFVYFFVQVWKNSSLSLSLSLEIHSRHIAHSMDFQIARVTHNRTAIKTELKSKFPVEHFFSSFLIACAFRSFYANVPPNHRVSFGRHNNLDNEQH